MLAPHCTRFRAESTNGGGFRPLPWTLDQAMSAHLPKRPQVVLCQRPRRRLRRGRAVRSAGACARLQSPACRLGQTSVGCLRSERSHQGRQRGWLRLQHANTFYVA